MRISFVSGPRKGESVEVTKRKAVIGRDSGCDVVLDDEEVSRKHAELTVEGDSVVIRDLGSQNGTKVGRSDVRESKALTASDKVTIGASGFTVSAEGDAGATRVAGGTRGGGTRLARGVPAMIEVVGGPAEGKTIEVTSSGTVIGRDRSADVRLDDDEISREHIEVSTNEDGTVEVTDLGSRNGTIVDGKRISKATTVADGAQISIGRSRLKVSTTAKSGGRGLGAGARGGMPRAGVIAAVLGGLAVIIVALLVTGVIGGSDDGSGEPLTTSEIVEKVQPSTVQVLGRQAGRTIPLGTGWVLDAEAGLVVTNAHVVEGAPNGARFALGIDNFPRRAEVYAVAPCEDLALLRTSGLDLPNMPLAESQSDLQAGDEAVALGYPVNLTLAEELSVNDGTVSVPETRAEASTLDPNFPLYENVIQIDTPINPGNSGGPLVNDRGELIGVNTFGATTLQNTNYAIGVDRVKEITDQMRGGDSLAFAGFGFKGGVVIGPFSGLQVQNVLPNFGADRIGIPAGELIQELNGRRVITRSDYCNAVQDLSSGSEATVTGVVGSGRVVMD